MANDKKFVVKNGLSTQNLQFVDEIGSANNTITVSMLSNDTLSFSGDTGQLFSITDSQTGTIFAVNDISGVPSIEVDDDGTIRFAETFGNVLVGTATDNGTDKLQINGDVAATTFKGALSGNANTATTLQTARSISLGGVLTGSASFDGSANITITAAHTSDPTITLTGAVTGSGTMTDLGSISIATTATADPTLTLTGDVTGSATFTNLGNATLTATVADDSHNHIWGNIDGGSVNAWGGLRHSTSSGYIDFGPANTSYAHIYTDLPEFYFNKEIRVLDGRVFHDGYHPNADTLTTARTISFGGDLSGSASFDGSANITITATVADDSHNHIIANVDGLQDILDGKADGTTTISAGGGLTGGGSLAANRTISHADTSTQASLTALTGASVISDIDLDTYGHVTNLATRALTLANLGYTGDTNAQANQNTFSNIAVSGQTTVSADTTTDTLTLVAGSNVTITTNATSDSVTIDAEGGATIVNDTTTNATRYLAFTDQTSGSENTFNVSSTKLYFNPSTGQLNATDFNALSDEKLKSNIITIENPIKKVTTLRGVNFDWLETGDKSMGVIAQEVEKIIPEVVNGDETKSVNYNGMVGLLIEAIKEQQKQIDELKSYINRT